MKTIDGFKNFVLRGNAVDLAVGVVIGAAFGGLVNSLVADLLTPLIGAIAKVPDFSSLAFTINGSEFRYGAFLNATISFVLVAVAVYFFVIVPMQTLLSRTRKEGPTDPTTKQCSQCKSEINISATRCAFCTEPV